MTFYWLIRTSWPVIGPVLGAYSLINGIGLTLPEVWAATQTYVLQVNSLWLLASAVFFFLTYTELRHRGIPLTAVDTEICLTYEDPGGKNVRLVRSQKLRANREDVTGYIRQMWSDGTIPREDFECSIEHCLGEQKVEFDRNSKGVELIHRFPPIPRNLFTLGTNTVKRTDRLLCRDGFTSDQECYEVTIPPYYRHHRLKIAVQFHPSRPCAFKDFKAIRISAHGIVDLHPAHATNGGFTVEAKKIRGGERFRVQWTLPPVLTT